MNSQVVNNPCRVARGQSVSSLVEIGNGRLPDKAADDVMLPILVTEIESENSPDQSTRISDKIRHQSIGCRQSK